MFVPDFDLPAVERPGGFGTVNATGANFRRIIDLSDLDRSVATNAPGQSAQPGSPFYGNLRDYLGDGEYFSLLFSREAVEGNVAHRLIAEAGVVLTEPGHRLGCLPEPLDGTNFMPPSFNPALGVMFVTARESCATFVPQEPQIESGRNSWGGASSGSTGTRDTVLYARSICGPVTGRIRSAGSPPVSCKVVD